MSSISIIGLGNMASALADRALAGGNAVEIIGRDPAKAKELAAALAAAPRSGRPAPPRPGTSSSSPCRTPARRPVVEPVRGRAAGKVIIDITNPVHRRRHRACHP